MIPSNIYDFSLWFKAARKKQWCLGGWAGRGSQIFLSYIWGGGGSCIFFQRDLGGGGSSKFLPTTWKCNRPPPTLDLVKMTLPLCSGQKIKARILTCQNACYQNVADASCFVFQIFKLRKTGSDVKHNTEVWTQWVSCKVSDAQGVKLTLRSYFNEQQKN